MSPTNNNKPSTGAVPKNNSNANIANYQAEMNAPEINNKNHPPNTDESEGKVIFIV